MKIPWFKKGTTNLSEDLVCNMMVEINNPPGGKVIFNSMAYYFCAPGCKIEFQKDPIGYISGEKHNPM